jgi:long-subunit acyl-CoA synthetase (AMP-forming)
VTRVAVLSREFSVEDGTLTRTLKLRRPAIRERYAGLIEGLYRP